MTAIRVIFDGKAFIPQGPVSLPEQAEAMVFFEPSTVRDTDLDRDVRAYYQQIGGGDADDEAWAKATAPGSSRAWDEK